MFQVSSLKTVIFQTILYQVIFYNSKVMDFTVVKNNLLRLHDTEWSRLGYQTAVWSYAF